MAGTTAQALIATHGIWGEHRDYPAADWRYEVQNDDTRLGYWEWVAAKLE